MSSYETGRFILGKSRHSTLFVLLIVASIFFMACNDGASGNFAPIIELQEIELVKNDTGRDSLLFIHFTYEDKDGNLGLSDSDTSGAFRGANNLMINFREKNNGVYTPLLNRISGLPANFNQRIPNLTPTGKNKEISGTISVSFGVDPNEIYADTIAFDLYIEDRSFNQSNVIEATDVVLVQ